MDRYGLEQHGILGPSRVRWNLAPTRLVEEIVRRGEGVLTSTGAVVLDNTIEKATFRRGPVFGLEAPTKLPGAPAELLNPRLTAKDLPEYERRARDLAKKFVSNFEQFKGVSPEIMAAAPRTT
jgi:ATP-dependent phosphoenolpyruvate carboxykinase